MKDREKRIILLLTMFTIIFTMLGGTFAYFRWATSNEQNTNVTFTVTPNFSCSGDGGGTISSNEIRLEPTECTNTENVIKREVNLSTTSRLDNTNIYFNLWLDVINIGSGLTNSQNLKYTLSTTDSCTENIVTRGNFKDITNKGRVNLLEERTFVGATTKKFYLYIWLDAKEESSSTMNQAFTLEYGGSCTDIKSTNAPSAPTLDDGLIPVTIADNGDVTTISSTDSSWYDYDNKKWANAVVVKESGVKTRTANKVAGTKIDKSDILGYFVWIPRYSYAIPELKCSEIETVNETEHPNCYLPVLTNESDMDNLVLLWSNLYSLFYSSQRTEQQLTNDIKNGLATGYIEADVGPISIRFLTDFYYPIAFGSALNYTLEYNPNNIAPSSINIRFENSDTSKSIGNAVGINYRTHPAFTFGAEELDGIWVGKFETTQGTSENIGTNNPTILPGITSWRAQNISTQFNNSLLLSGNNTYGLTTNTDSHMMKNSEWGAVTYLSHSSYGINKEIRINNNSNYLTGCGASMVDGTVSETCEITYGTEGVSNYPQSTTGNISGVFDMNGGSSEYVMANYNNVISSSGFATLPDSKYYDIYETTGILTACNGSICYGHALSETIGWYNDIVNFVGSGNPWLVRIGGFENGLMSGAFAAGDVAGSANVNFGFRVVLSQ